jgi:uncharacterized OB-fold protein/acyl dehydratase
MAIDDTTAAIRQAAERIAAAGQSPPRAAPDPVNLPMIRHWTQAMGDTNPIYTDAGAAAASVHGQLVAPPAMVQVWTMRGLRPAPDAGDSGDPLGLMTAVLDDARFTSVVATNSEQEYYRYLRPGEQLTVRSSLEGVTGPKQTALGEGWFVTTRSTWYAGDEAVAAMRFRVLKYRGVPGGRPPGPAERPAAPPLAAADDVLRPVVTADTAFFWDGTARGELRIQRCRGCGALRHPPGPMCPACGADKPEYLLAAGTGEVYSYVVHHHPPVPGHQAPFVVALVQLTEGVRMVGELLGVDPDQVRVGMPVRAEFVKVDSDLTLPAWRQAEKDASLYEADRSDTPQPPGRTPPQLRCGAPAPRPVLARGDDPPEPPVPPEAREAPQGRPPARGARKQSVLPELVIDVTPTFVISTAIATRDFQDVHHDRDKAVARGGKDIFINILTSSGLVQRYVTGWAGPDALVRKVDIRLGVPCYAGDTLTFSGRVIQAGEGQHSSQDCVVEVVGRCGLGDHVTGMVRVCLPGGTR